MTEKPRGPIGVFDSGFGGLTVLRSIRNLLPRYDYIYLGDNARAPYGNRSFDTVYTFTLQAVKALFDRGCPLVILACNTASAKALRTIQQKDLPVMEDSSRRVLGVIRPTAEKVAHLTDTGHIGIFATPGTVASGSYQIEIAGQNPNLVTVAHPCPMWVPLIENGQAHTPGADYFIEKDAKELMSLDPEIDTVILGCTHYPIVKDIIGRHLPPNVRIVSQGEIVAASLEDYLNRHPEMECRLSRAPEGKDGTVTYLTTETPEIFNPLASVFAGHPVQSSQITVS